MTRFENVQIPLAATLLVGVLFWMAANDYNGRLVVKPRPAPEPEPKPVIVALADPAWYTYKAYRKHPTPLKTLTDICEHCLNVFRGEDAITTVHESTHGINAQIRNYYNKGVNAYNAFYVLDDKAVVLKEPQVTLSQLASRVKPAGTGYSLYLTGAHVSHWQHQPLYVLDEMTAYSNGTQAGCEAGIRDRVHEYQMAREMLGYSQALYFATLELDPKYPDFEKLALYLDYAERRLDKLADEYPELKAAVPVAKKSPWKVFRKHV